MTPENMYVGAPVIFTDMYGKDHAALVTAIHGALEHKPAINLLYVSSDESKQDQYGRQIERPSSVCYASWNSAGAYCYRLPGEPKPARVAATV